MVQIAAGGFHTCALLSTGKVRCWGFGGSGRLGYASTLSVGDDETPSAAGDVDLGGSAVQISAGSGHTCALLDTGKVRCWGQNFDGRLGYANTLSVGDDETPASAGDVDVGGPVAQISAGGQHTCARLATGAVRCFGEGLFGRLGYGAQGDIGDNEPPSAAGDVDLGGPAVDISAGLFHTCALLAGGEVRCWGAGDTGRLGYGNTDTIGDDEAPAQAGDVDVGGAVVALEAGNDHTCAALSGGALRCWGNGFLGVLGYGDTERVGDDETPAAAGDVPVF